MDFLQDHGFTQIVDFPTRGHNTLDIYAINRPSLVVSCKPVSGIGDHEAILTCSTLLVESQPTCKRKIYNWAKADWDQIGVMAESFCNSFISDYSDSVTPVELLWNLLKTFVYPV